MALRASSCNLACIPLLILAACGSNPEEPAPESDYLFQDAFSYPDSATPNLWSRTGGTGDGYYGVLDSAYAHVSGEHCSYYRYDPENLELGNGIYDFDVFGPYWEFAWRVSTSSAYGGTCRRLGNYPNYWEGYFMRPAANWTGGPYAWQNGEGETLHSTSGPDPAGPHHVSIQDSGDWVKVTIDGDVIFDEAVMDIPAGIIGIGCGDTLALPPAYGPTYDNVGFAPASI